MAEPWRQERTVACEGHAGLIGSTREYSSLARRRAARHRGRPPGNAAVGLDARQRDRGGSPTAAAGRRSGQARRARRRVPTRLYLRKEGGTARENKERRATPAIPRQGPAERAGTGPGSISTARSAVGAGPHHATPAVAERMTLFWHWALPSDPQVGNRPQTSYLYCQTITWDGVGDDRTCGAGRRDAGHQRPGRLMPVPRHSRPAPGRARTRNSLSRV